MSKKKMRKKETSSKVAGYAEAMQRNEFISAAVSAHSPEEEIKRRGSK